MAIGNIFSKIKKFLKEVGLEIKKVTWPTKKEIFKNTLLVIGISLALAVFLGGLDFLFKKLLEKFIL